MQILQRAGRCACVVAVLVVFCCHPARALAGGDAKKNTKYPQQILVIRHAEKTGDKDDIHLSKQGKVRAEMLPQLFMASKERPDPFPTPDFLFAAAHHKDSQRPVETVTPLAMKLKLTIDDRYDNKVPTPAKKIGMMELRDEIFGTPKYFGKTILVSWRHSTIPELAKTLKAAKVPEKWDDNIFDRVWHITYDDQGNVTFRDRPQRLLPGDAEK
jgi:hypothetical protein